MGMWIACATAIRNEKYRMEFFSRKSSLIRAILSAFSPENPGGRLHSYSSTHILPHLFVGDTCKDVAHLASHALHAICVGGIIAAAAGAALCSVIEVA